MRKTLFLGGQFTPAPGGQFGPARGGQFSPASGGQFDRFLQISSGSCIYINKIEDIDLKVLREIISASVTDMKKKYKIN